MHVLNAGERHGGIDRSASETTLAAAGTRANLSTYPFVTLRKSDAFQSLTQLTIRTGF